MAVHIDGRWHRQDPRGDRPGIDAQSRVDRERLAYQVDPSIGEIDYPDILVRPAAAVIHATAVADDALVLCDGGLPSSIGGQGVCAEDDDGHDDDATA